MAAPLECNGPISAVVLSLFVLIPSVHASHWCCPKILLMSLSVLLIFLFPFPAQGDWGFMLVCGGRLQPALSGAQLGSALVLVLANQQAPAAQA